MPSPDERERPEPSGGPSSTSPPDTLALQTLMDVQRSLGQLESSVTELERSTAQHAKDLNGLGKVAHSATLFSKVALGIATPVVATITIAVLVYIYRIIERLLLLAK